ncbi:MAG: B-4DMT family transporter, partial [Mycobacterium sp.]
MSKWLLRGVVLAALMVIIRLLQGAMIGAWEKQALWISISLLVVFGIVTFVWGLLDGQKDAKAQADPDRRDDLAMVWLLGGLFAGVISGLVCWIISQFYDAIYTGGLLSELTTFAAFTALIAFVLGVCGVALGRWLIDRNAPPPPKHD